MEKKSLYEREVYEGMLKRIEKIKSTNTPAWGKMTAAQMMAHCAEVQEVTNGKALKNTPFMLKVFKNLIKSAVINEKPYPKGAKTHPQYIQQEDKDFEKEKARFIEAITTFYEHPDSKVVHSLFGPMSNDEKGWAMYKHHDHHLKQFGV